MNSEWHTFLVLLGPKFKGILRLGHSREQRHPVRLLVFGGLGVLFALGIFSGSLWFLRQCLEVELVGTLLPRKLMSLVLLVLISILLLSTTISSFSVLFLSEDLGLLFSAPVPVGPLYYARFVEMLLYSSWMVLFFGLPVFVAFGVAYSAPASYYVLMGSLFPAIILIPAALGAMIAAVLTRLFSARRSRDLLIVLSVLGFVFVYLLVRAMKPERLLEEQGFGTMVEFLNMFRATDTRFLPTAWMTSAVYPLLEGKLQSNWLPALGLWSTAAFLVTVSGWVVTALYRVGFARAHEGRIRWSGATETAAGRSRMLGGWLDRFGRLWGDLTGSLMVKDLRVFMRDTNQWLQLMLLGALAAVYLLNFAYLKVAKFSWFTLYTVNHVLLGLVISGIAVRFVFPAVSLEGRSFWIIQRAPIELGRFLHSKFLISFFPLAGLGLFLSILSGVIVEVPAVFMVCSVSLVLAMTLGVCAIGIGFGAIYPRFTVENPAKIPTGVGGVVFMIVSSIYVLIFLLLTFYPTFILFQLPQRLSHPVHHPGRLALSLGITVLFVILSCWLPMFLGKRKLARFED